MSFGDVNLNIHLNELFWKHAFIAKSALCMYEVRSRVLFAEGRRLNFYLKLTSTSQPCQSSFQFRNNLCWVAWIWLNTTLVVSKPTSFLESDDSETQCCCESLSGSVDCHWLCRHREVTVSSFFDDKSEAWAQQMFLVLAKTLGIHTEAKIGLV